MSSESSELTIDKLFLNTDTSDEFIRQMMSSVLLAAKKSNEIPKGAEFNYYSISSKFSESSSELGKGSLGLINELCQIVSTANESSRFCLSEDLSDTAMFDQVMDVVDGLLDGADSFFEKHQIQSNGSAISNDNLESAVREAMNLDKERILQQESKVESKPQNKFLDEINNSRNTPFCPKLKKDDQHRKNLQPLSSSGTQHNERTPLNGDESINTYYPNPYEDDLLHLAYPSWCKGPSRLVLTDPAIESSSGDGKMPGVPYEPCVVIETVVEFDRMLDELTAINTTSGDPIVTEIAVDLEHHSFRSYQGLCCLIQLSTRREDYVIDALALRREIPRLGVIFMNPTIVKVLHGCEKDVLWLQRDFGLYILNCFDTFVAAKFLQYPALSLAHLLHVHCGIIADKKHQLADWRKRPLPDEMVEYARTDTRYLLYIFDCLRRELWLYGSRDSKALSNDCTTAVESSKEALEYVFFSSKKLCMQRYEKPQFDPNGYLALRDQARKLSESKLNKKRDYLKHNFLCDELEWNSVQEVALSALWNWRDITARNEDESCAYIMSNAEMIRIARCVPKTLAQLERCAPLSDSTRRLATEIIDLLANATSAIPSVPLSENHDSSDYKLTLGMKRYHEQSPGKFTFAPLLVPQNHDKQLSYSQTPSLPDTPSPCSTPSFNTTVEEQNAQQKRYQAQQMWIEQQKQKEQPVKRPSLVSFQSDVTDISSPENTNHIFKQAGWNTPAQHLLASDPDLLVHPDSPIEIGDLPLLVPSHGQSNGSKQFYPHENHKVNAEVKEKMRRSQEEFQRILHAKRMATNAILSGSNDDLLIEKVANRPREQSINRESNMHQVKSSQNRLNEGGSDLGLLHSTIRDLASADDVAALNRRQQFADSSTSHFSCSTADQADTSHISSTFGGNEDASLIESALENDSIPRTFEEIYRRSMESKQQKGKKDKKRARDTVQESLEDTTSDGISYENFGRKDSINALYFDGTNDIDNSVEGTLQFAKDIGWLNSEEDNKKIHEYCQKNLGDQSAEFDSSCVDQSADSALHGHQQALRRGHEKNRHQNSDSIPSHINRNKSNQGVQPFDYSQVPKSQSSTIGVLQSQRTNSNSRSQRYQQDSSKGRGGKHGGASMGGRGQQGRGNKTDYSNPYLFNSSKR